MTTVIETLDDMIARTKDLGDVQDQSTHAQYADRLGVIIAEINVEAEMARLGVAALPIGTYKLRYKGAAANADFRNPVVLPKGAVLLGLPVIHVHKAKAGAGTIGMSVGAVLLDTALNTTGVTADDDGAANALVRGRLSAADEEITYAVASNTVTAGAATITLEYALSNVV